MFNFYKNHKFLSVFFSVISSFLFLAVATYAATTISTNISTGGTLTVDGASTLTGAVTTGAGLTVGTSATVGTTLGVASTSPYVALGITGTTTSSAGMVVGKGGSAMTQVRFGTCTFDPGSITASTSVSTNCTSATGVQTIDRVFVTPVGLEKGIVMTSASSTSDAVIQVTVLNTGWSGSNGTAIDPASSSWFWMAVR